MPLKTILSLDIGDQRVGVALANSVARLPAPVGVIQNGDVFVQKLQAVIDREQPVAIVVGLPRGLNGQETAQTKVVRKIAEDLKKRLNVPIYLQDEALTSAKAEAELKNRGKTYSKSDVDSLAACYILEDWLGENRETF